MISWRGGAPRLARTLRTPSAGVALVSVVSVLVLLMIVATPFLLSMRDSAKRGERFLHDERVDAEAESLFEQVNAHLVSGLEHVERQRLDSLGAGGAATGAQRPPDDATPSSDTPPELSLPQDTLRMFNQATLRDHRVWDVDVADAQSRFNLNSCSVGVLANLLGRTELTDDLRSGTDRVSVGDPSVFPADGGVVRIGAEVVKYEKVAGGQLVGCTRGYRSDLPENGADQDHVKGVKVISEAAFQLATRPFRARPGSWVRYTNLYEARTISEMGVTTLPAADFDRIRRFLTAWNGDVVGDGWSNPQLVRNNIGSGEQTDLYAQIKNVRYFGPGTVVRITDGVNDDYAVVVEVRGANQVVLAGNLRNSYLADQARIYTRSRAAINPNTADEETLALVFDGLGMRGRTSTVSPKAAASLAAFLKRWARKSEDPAVTPEPGCYRTWEDFVAALEEARDAQGILGQDEFEAVLRNALNACDSELEFSTVPFTFRSFDVYEARATAALLGLQGQELARRELTRTFEVSSARSSTFVLETQADFQEQIRISRDAKWFVSYPANVNAYYDGVNLPASEYRAYSQLSRFPDTDRAPGAGHLQLLAGAFRLAGRTDRYFHFDEQPIPDGLDLEEQSLDVSVDAPYGTKDRKIDAARFIQVPSRGEETELGLAPFACSFWYRPAWDLDSSEHVIFDYGADEEFMNRVSLRYVPQKGLVLAVSDATREQRAAEVVFDFDKSPAQVTWATDTWYHVACTVYACAPDMMELFVDGEQVGRSNLLTRTRNSIQATGDIGLLSVEDASGFPDSGVLLLRSQEGIELIEYTSRDDNAFTVSRRKARCLDVVLDQSQEARRAHNPGATVQLYGFAAPLLTDIRTGGASLASALGPWRAYRVVATDDSDTAMGGAWILRGIAYIQGHQNQITLTEWETGNPADTTTLDDLGPVGTEGIACISSFGTFSFIDAATNQPITFSVQAGTGGGSGTNDGTVGGMDVVHYRVDASDGDGAKVTLLNRGLVLRHYDASLWVTQAPNGGRFIPCYDYGADAGANFPLTPYQWNDPTTNAPLPQPGTFTAFVPMGILAQGSNADYLDPVDSEPQLAGGTPGPQSVGAPAYVQVDSEWIRYDTFDDALIAGRVAFYRDWGGSGGTGAGIPGIGSLFRWGGVGSAIRTVLPVASSGVGGGIGSVGSNAEPQHAEDGNDERTAPPQPATGASGGLQQLEPPPQFLDNLAIATAADFRSWEDRNTNRIRRIANTIARDHRTGTEIVPCFAVYNVSDWDVTAMGRRAHGGFDDLVTLRDARGSDEQIRIQWGYARPVPSSGIQGSSGWSSWMAPTEPVRARWNWDRPQELSDLGRYPSAAWTRALKFPSREMPDALLTQNSETLRFGKKFDDSGGTTPGVVDELVFHELAFPADDRRDYVFLGAVPQQIIAPTAVPGSGPAAPITFPGIDEKSDEIPVFMPYWDEALRAIVVNGLGIPAEVFPTDGGIVKIDDELILYSRVDTGSGLLQGCQRGRFGTIAQSHEYGAIVFPVESFACSRLTSDADDATASFEVADASDFADDGYLRIADSLELIGYTEIQGNRLTGPLARIDPASEEPPQPRDPADKRTGGALFRGRFGTTAVGYSQDDVALAMPWRHYDRYSERSDDPENSYSQFSWTRENAIWKRISWDERPVANVEVIALVRFSGGPAWDSDRVIRVGQQPMPREDRRGWLYEITDPEQENLLNVEADRCEVRLMVRFAQGAYDRNATPRPNEWKQTPWIRRAVVEYVSPSSVLSQE